MIELDRKQFEGFMKLLDGVKDGYATAASRAVNRTLQGAATMLTKQVTSTYTIKAREVKSDITLKKATKGSPEGELEIRGGRKPLSDFKVRPRADTTHSQKPVTAELKRGSEFEVRSGFVWKGKVLRRTTTQSLPVSEENGPAVAQMAGTKETLDAVDDFISEKLPERMDHEVGLLLDKATK